MWWVWALALAAALLVVVLMLRRRRASGTIRKEDLPAHKRVDQEGSNPDLPGGLGGI